MAAWRIVASPHDLLHRVHKAKYFHDTSIWCPNPHVPKSAFWASILKVIPLLQTHSFFQITQGNISVWSTPWCQAWTRIYDDLILQQQTFVYPALVKDLWLPDQRAWNEQLIDTLFHQPTAQIIKQTPIISSQEQDILCWKFTPNGKCNSKSAYCTCLQRLHELGEPRPTPPPPATIQLLNQVWKDKNIIPRVQAFAWRFLRRAIPTGVRAGKYSKHISKLCCRCGLEEDDIHLFCTCHFAMIAWFGAPWFIRTDILTHNCSSLTQILLNLQNLNHPHASLQNILTFMWCIWKSRNDCLFNRKNGAPYQININAQALCNSLELHDSSNPTLQVQQKTNSTSTSMLPSAGNTIKTDLSIEGPKVYSDAAWNTKNSSSGKKHKDRSWRFLPLSGWTSCYEDFHPSIHGDGAISTTCRSFRTCASSKGRYYTSAPASHFSG
jgi:hypothetical protein